MKKQVKSRNRRAKRHNARSNAVKAALIPAVVKRQARRKRPAMAKAEIPVAVKTGAADNKPAAVATAEIPVEVNIAPKRVAGRSRQTRGKRTSNATVLPMAVARNGKANYKRTAPRRTPRHAQRVVARREPKPVRNRPVVAPNLLGLVVSAATALEERVINAAAKLSLVVIGGVESIIRRVFRFEKHAATKVAEVVESIPREAASAASRVAGVVDTLAAA